MSSPIALDRYIYEAVYPAFKAATDEKEITARINCALLNHLAAHQQTLAGDAPLFVADIGCGPCDTLVKYLAGVRFAPGFNLRATDFIPAYADAHAGEALQILRAAQAAHTLNIASFAVRAGDAFAGHLLDLLTAPHDGPAMRRAFRIVFASHMMYHADSAAAVARFIAAFAGNLLAPDGVCIMYHLASTPGTFQDFRARFGSQAGQTHDSDTGAVTVDDPPAQIVAACAALDLPLYQTEFRTNLRFGPLGESEWRAFKDPSAYAALAAANPNANEDLKRLYFVVQRAPREFAADRSPTGLAAFIDEIRAVIEANHDVLPLAERIQILIRADAPPALRTLLPSALSTAIAIQ